MSFDDMGYRACLDRNANLLAESLLGGLLDARWDFVRLTIPPADFAVAVADNHHRGGAKAAATLDHGATAANLDSSLEILRMR